MRTTYILFLQILLSVISCSCSKNVLNNKLKIIPNNDLINAQLPDDYSKRVFFQNTSIVREELDNFVGSVVYIDTIGAAEIAMYPSLVKINVKAFTKPIKDGVVFQSKITNSWSQSASFKSMFNIGLNFSNEQAYEMILEDAAYTTMNKDSINWQRVSDLAKISKPANIKCRCLVINSYLSTILYRGFKKIDSKANVAIGDVFQVNDITYNSQANKLTKDYRVSFGCYDIDKAYAYLKSNNAFDSDSEKQKKENVVFLKALMSEEAVSTVLTGGVIKSFKND